MAPVACQQEAQGKIRRVLPLYLAVVFAAGALIATQAGVNSQLTRAVGHPVLAATISFMVGTAVLLVGSLGVMGSWTTSRIVKGTSCCESHASTRSQESQAGRRAMT